MAGCLKAIVSLMPILEGSDFCRLLQSFSFFNAPHVTLLFQPDIGDCGAERGR